MLPPSAECCHNWPSVATIDRVLSPLAECCHHTPSVATIGRVLPPLECRLPALRRYCSDAVAGSEHQLPALVSRTPQLQAGKRAGGASGQAEQVDSVADRLGGQAGQAVRRSRQTFVSGVADGKVTNVTFKSYALKCPRIV